MMKQITRKTLWGKPKTAVHNQKHAHPGVFLILGKVDGMSPLVYDMNWKQEKT